MTDVVQGTPVRRPYSRVYSPKRCDCGTVLGPGSVPDHLMISWDEVPTITEDYPCSLLEDVLKEPPTLEGIEEVIDGTERDQVKPNSDGFQVILKFGGSHTVLQVYLDSTFSVLIRPYNGPRNNLREAGILHQKVLEFLNAFNLEERL